MKIRILGARFSPDNLDHDKTSEDKNTFDISKRVVNNITGALSCTAQSHIIVQCSLPEIKKYCLFNKDFKLILLF